MTQRQPIATIIRDDGEDFDLYADGSIGRPAIQMPPSGEWKVTGAVTLNRFGNTVARYSLEEILFNPYAIPWKYKNGKQKTFITDLDHGTRRQWMNPSYSVQANLTNASH